MTCIVGLETQSGVVMGGDSASISGYDSDITKLEKVFVKDGKFLIGYTSSFRMGQLIEYKFSPPVQEEGQDDLEYLVCDFVDKLRECLKDGGYTRIDSNQEQGGYFLLGYKGKLYNISSDFQVNRSGHGFDAVGCGADYAKAVMYITKEAPPMIRIEKALEVAEVFSCGVARPFIVKNIGNE